MQTGRYIRKPNLELVRRQLEEDGRKTAINRTNRQRKLEQRIGRMFSTTWKVEDIFPGWLQTKLEDWGSSDPSFIEMNAALAAFELDKGLVMMRRSCARQSSTS
jgi:hypothetical protein